MITKPLLATEAPADIRFPILASAKLDGIRGIIGEDGVLYSRSGKPIPNKHVQSIFNSCAEKCPDICGLDGELIVGEPTAKDVFRVTTSGVMSHTKTPQFRFYVFDHVAIGTQPFEDRYATLQKMSKDGKLPTWVIVLAQIPIADKKALEAVEEVVVGQGYEGLIIRDPRAAYKHGRSSAKEGILLKVRRFKDSEAEVIGFTEELENQNVATKDAFGRTERSSHQDNLVGKNALGAFMVRDLKTQREFQVGTGYTRVDREEFWKQKKNLLGKIIKYRFFEVGVKDLPRFPVFQGFRDPRDMS